MKLFSVRHISRPMVGDKVAVYGSPNFFGQRGVVSSVYEEYCWLDVFSDSGKYIRSFTASFSYCKFHKVP